MSWLAPERRLVFGSRTAVAAFHNMRFDRRLLFFFLTISTTTFVRGETVLTLGGVLDDVDRANLDVLLGREAVAQAVAQAGQARAGLLPDVTLDAFQQRSRSAQSGSAVVRSGVRHRFDVELNGQIELVNPTVVASYQAAKHRIGVASLDAAATRETVLAAVASLYFQHQRNLRRIEVLDANVSRANSLRELAQRQIEAGVATQIDLTRAEAQLAGAELARLQQETVVQGSELSLKRFLARDLAQPLALSPIDLPRTPSPDFTPTLAESALGARADVRAAEAALEQNELEVRAAKFNRLPSLSALGAYGYTTELAFDGDEQKIWSLALAVSVPVFDGARTNALTRLALSRQRAQALQVDDAKRQVDAEVRLAAQDARSRLAQVTVAERSLHLAEDELRLAQTRFEQGAADNREIVDAQNSLAVAGDNVVEAIYRYNVSRVELARALGSVRAILDEGVR